MIAIECKPEYREAIIKVAERINRGSRETVRGSDRASFAEMLDEHIKFSKGNRWFVHITPDGKSVTHETWTFADTDEMVFDDMHDQKPWFKVTWKKR